MRLFCYLMRRVALVLCVLGSMARAADPIPLTLPPVELNSTTVPANTLEAIPTAPLVFQIAQQIRVQPSRLELQFQPGYSVGTLNFALFSEVNTQVTFQSEDSRLVIRDGQFPLRLLAHQIQSVTAVASAPHTGAFRILNTRGETIARVPYTVLPPKTVNQNVYFNYTPSGHTASLSYGVSGVTQTPSDPRWSAGVSIGVDTRTSTLSGGVSIGISW